MSVLLRVVACGSVDDGKSTLIGRLLVETDSVPLDTLEQAKFSREAGSTIPLGEIDYSLLTDGLQAEREQGITIDVAYRQFELPSGKRVIVADAPGHEQYTRNMAVAASRSDLAILLIDAARGVSKQTHRHLTVCALMGVKDVVFAINKLDVLGYDKDAFDRIVDQATVTANRMGVERITAVPVSALNGVNVTARSSQTPWYLGPTVLEALVAFEPVTANVETRLPVQMVLRTEQSRVYAGTLVSGAVHLDDEIMVASSGAKSRVIKIHTPQGIAENAYAGTAIGLELKDQVDVTRGDLLTPVKYPAKPADRFAADVVWLGESPLVHGRSYLLISGPLQVPATILTLRHKLDVETGAHEAARVLHMNDVGAVELATDRPVALDPYDLSRDTGGFVLVDRLTADTVAAGMVKHAMRRSFNVVPHIYQIDRGARAQQKAQKAKVIWLTGLPGSGKSTIANEAERKLHSLGLHTYVLDGDNLRTGLNKDLGFTPEDRAENVRRVGEVARLLFDAGLIVLVALVSPFRADREKVRTLFEPGDFVEIYVSTPVEVCQQRDPKGLYKKAAAGSLPNLTGVGQGYEEPSAPELVLRGDGDLSDEADQLVRAVLGEP
ncbi:MAG: adenylyl-sulfate kinase [Actinobacteria bacterium]|nr:adenylyl-sulfate kinase [Actinomycetota bacterium]